MVRIKLLVLKQFEFDHQEMTKVIAVCLISGLSGFKKNEQNR